MTCRYLWLAALVIGSAGTAFAQDSGGPDAAGYTWDTVAFEYEDISGAGRIVLGDDQVSGGLPIGFDFPFYGAAYDTAYVSSNGFITFRANASSGCCAGHALPSAANPDNLIAGYWEDLHPGLGGRIDFARRGAAPNRRFIVQFTGIQHFGGGRTANFQIVLFESGTFQIRHLSSTSDGGSHTVGFENADGSIGLNVRRGSFSLQNTAFQARSCAANAEAAVGLAPDGGEVQTCTPELSWNGAGRRFEVFVNGASQGETGETRLVLPPAALEPGENTWFVRTHGCEDSVDSAEATLVVGDGTAPPPPPVLDQLAEIDCSPVEGEPPLTRVSWEGAAGVVYDVVLNGSTVARDLDATRYDFAETQIFQPRNTWIVVARNCAGETASAESEFDAVTGLEPVAAAPVTPAPNDTVYCDPRFTWNTNGGPFGTLYQVWVYQPQDPVNPIRRVVTLDDELRLEAADRLASGAYRWRVVATNCIGETALSGVRQFFVENAPPAPVLDEPPVNAWTDSTPAFTWTHQGARGDVTFDVVVDGEMVATDVPVEDEADSTGFTLPDEDALEHGAHDWRVVATGCLSEQSNSGAARDFRADARPPPAFELIAPTADDWFGAGGVEFEWEPAVEGLDEGGGTESCTLTVGPGDEPLAEAVIPAPGAEHNLTAGASHGFENDTDGWSFAGDGNLWGRQNPGRSGAWSLAQSAGRNYETDTDSTATLAGTYLVSAADDMSYWLVGTGFEDFDFFMFQVRPEGGNWTTIHSHTGRIANWRLFTPDLSDYVGDRVEVRFRFTSNEFQGNVGYLLDDFAIRGVHLPDGSHSWRVRCTDVFGNTRESDGEGTVNIDRTSPSQPILEAPEVGSSTNNPRPAFEWAAAVDATSGVVGHRVLLYSTEGELLASSGDELLPADALSWRPQEDLPEARYIWEVVAVDRAGNERASLPGNVLLDRTPAVPPELVSPVGVTGDFELCWNDSESPDVCSYRVLVDGDVEYASINASEDARRRADGCVDFFNFPVDGPHSWAVIATDCAGNVSDPAVADFVLETSPPQRFVATEPANGVTVNTLSPLFCWEAAVDLGTGIAGYELFIDDMNEPALEIEPPEDDVVCTRTEPLANGNHTWRVDALDAAGNRTRATGMPWGFTVEQDIFPPTCGITSPQPGALAGCVEYTFEGTAADTGPNGRRGSGIARVEFQVDGPGGEWSVADLTGTERARTWAGRWDGDTGQHTLYCRAVDREGNVQEEPTARGFTVDCAGPRAFGLQTPANGSFQGACPTFRWDRTSDDLTNMGRYVLRITAEDGTVAEHDAGLATSFTLEGDACLQQGTYTWLVKAYDALNNVTDARNAYTVEIDLTGPVGFPLLAQNGVNEAGWTSADQVLVRWSASADPGGVGLDDRPYEVYLDGAPLARTAATEYTLRNLAEGRHTWTVRAYDALGNHTDATVRAPLGAFGVDTTGPGVAETVSLRVYANDVPTLPGRHNGTPRDTGLRVTAGERVRLEAQGQLCFTDDASCDPALVGGFCMGPNGNDNPPGNFSKFYQPFAYGRLVASVAGREVQPVDVGTGAEIVAPSTGRLQLAVNDNDTFNCRSRWHNVSAQRISGFNLSLPPDGVVTSEVRPTLVWSEVDDGEGSGVDRLEVVVDGDVVEGNLAADATEFELPDQASLVEGTHRWQVRAYDILGNRGDSDTWTIRVDLTPPEPFGLAAPEEGAVLDNKTPQLCWEATRDTESEVAHYLLFVDDEYNTAQLPEADPCQTPRAPLDEGRHCFQVVAQDELRHERTSGDRRCFTVDTEAPEPFELLTPDPGTESFTARPRFCWETTSDAGTGVQHYEVWLSGNRQEIVPQPDPLPDELCWQPAGPLPNGDYQWFVVAVDGAGAETVADARAVTIDRDVTPPEVTIVEPVADELYGRDGVPVACRADDGGRGTGVAELEVFERDDPDAFAAAEFDAELGLWRVTWPVVADGQLSLCCRATDNEGNINPAQGDRRYPCVTVRTDVSPPRAFAALAPGDNAWRGRRPTFDWEATVDDVAGLSTYVLAIEGRPELEVGDRPSHELTEDEALPDGAYTWTVAALDQLRNRRDASNHLRFRVDGQPPRDVDLLAPGDGAWHRLARVELCWSEGQDRGESGVCGYRLRLDGEIHPSDDPCFTPPVDLEDGDYDWAAAAVDCAGNVGPISPARTVRVDRTPPRSPSPTFPDDGARARDNPPTFRWLFAEDAPGNPSGVCAYRVTLGDETEEVDADANALEWPRLLADGEIRWSVRAVDCAGNPSAAAENRTLRLDTVRPPQVVVTEPASDAILVGARPTIRWEAVLDDATEVCAYIVTVDDEALRVAADATEMLVDPALEEGAHTVTVQAEDCAGNQSEAGDPTPFLVDLTPPTAPELVAPEVGACVPAGPVEFVWADAFDGVSGVAVFDVRIDGEVAAADRPADDDHWLHEPALADGAHEWSVVVHDRAGHEATGGPSRFEVDSAAPVCEVVRFELDPESRRYTVHGTAADDGCGLSRVEIRIGDAEWVHTQLGDDGTWSYSLGEEVDADNFACQSVDAAGNTSEADVVNAVLDPCRELGACDPETRGCDVLRPDDTECDDGNTCTQADVCRAGICVGEAIRCDAQPDDVCDDERTALIYTGDAVCLDGLCIYESEAMVCDAAEGACVAAPGRCDEGVCVGADIDEGAACDDSDACTGDGTCDADGVCEPGEAVECVDPPAARCVDGLVWVVYAARGLCAAGECVYEPQAIECAEGCDAEGCLGAEDLCADVVCDAPPSDCFEPVGECADGLCSYELRAAGEACSDDDACTADDACDGAGRCVPGARERCDDPPAPFCRDANTWVTYAGRGACEAGECAYAEVEVPCPGGCDEVCDAPICEGVECNAPPGACFAEAGACADGVCTYEPLEAAAPCDDRDSCSDGDACDGLGACLRGAPRVCDTPPAGSCVDETRAQVYFEHGVCEDGDCTYEAKEVDCPNGCDAAAGRCAAEPCEEGDCDSPPSECHSRIGACVDGICEYMPLPAGEGPCDDGDECTNGDVCDGNGECGGEPLLCDLAPADECIDDATLRRYAEAGQCAAGACEYPDDDVECPAGCDHATNTCRDEQLDAGARDAATADGGSDAGAKSDGTGPGAEHSDVPSGNGCECSTNSSQRDIWWLFLVLGVRRRRRARQTHSASSSCR